MGKILNGRARSREHSVQLDGGRETALRRTNGRVRSQNRVDNVVFNQRERVAR